MRKTLLMIILISLSTRTAAGLTFSAGLYGALQGSLMSGEDHDAFQETAELFFEALYGQDYSRRFHPGVGAAIGLFATVGLGSRLAIQPEVRYGNRPGGFRLQNAHYDEDTIDLTFRYRVLEAALLLKYRITGNVRRGASLLLGPAVMHLVASPPALEIDDSIMGSSEDDFGSASNYKDYAFAAVGGVEYRNDFWAGPVFWMIGLRVQYQITSFDSFGPGFANDTAVHSAQIVLGLGRRSRE